MVVPPFPFSMPHSWKQLCSPSRVTRQTPPAGRGQSGRLCGPPGSVQLGAGVGDHKHPTYSEKGRPRNVAGGAVTPKGQVCPEPVSITLLGKGSLQVCMMKWTADAEPKAGCPRERKEGKARCREMWAEDVWVGGALRLEGPFPRASEGRTALPGP